MQQRQMTCCLTYRRSARAGRHQRRLVRLSPRLCKQRVETRLGDEVGDNGTRLPAPSLDVRGPLACANIDRASTVAGPDKAEVRARPRLFSYRALVVASEPAADH